MDREKLAFAGVARQAGLVRGGEVSSTELVELYLERIERLEPELNAFRIVMADRALADARQADARRGGIAEDAKRFAQPDRLQRRTRGFARLGDLIPRAVLDRTIADEARHAARIGELFRDHDFLLTPTAARPPVKAGQWEGLGALRTLLGMAAVYPFTGIWNMTGQPAISLPAPPASDGLPIGAQLIAPRDGEGRVLALAAQLEGELGCPRTARPSTEPKPSPAGAGPGPGSRSRPRSRPSAASPSACRAR